MAQPSRARPSAGSAETGTWAHTRSENGPTQDSQEPQGKTTIAPSVVQKIAGIAAREISGVHAMGGGASRAFGALRERIPGGGAAASTPGVQVEVGEKQAAIDLDLVADYGASIVDIAKAVRRNVITGVEQMTGLEVIEVNISVTDIHLPSEEPEETSPPETHGDSGEKQSRVQ